MYETLVENKDREEVKEYLTKYGQDRAKTLSDRVRTRYAINKQLQRDTKNLRDIGDMVTLKAIKNDRTGYLDYRGLNPLKCYWRKVARDNFSQDQSLSLYDPRGRIIYSFYNLGYSLNFSSNMRYTIRTDNKSFVDSCNHQWSFKKNSFIRSRNDKLKERELYNLNRLEHYLAFILRDCLNLDISLFKFEEIDFNNSIVITKSHLDIQRFAQPLLEQIYSNSMEITDSVNHVEKIYSRENRKRNTTRPVDKLFVSHYQGHYKEILCFWDIRDRVEELKVDVILTIPEEKRNRISELYKNYEEMRLARVSYNNNINYKYRSVLNIELYEYIMELLKDYKNSPLITQQSEEVVDQMLRVYAISYDYIEQLKSLVINKDKSQNIQYNRLEGELNNTLLPVLAQIYEKYKK